MPALLNPLSLPVLAREKIWLLLQAELEARIEGKVISGSGIGQSFTKENMPWEAFLALYNSFSDVMVGSVASTGGGARVRPNFSCRG